MISAAAAQVGVDETRAEGIDKGGASMEGEVRLLALVLEDGGGTGR
jgi:hypothetical protein